MSTAILFLLMCQAGMEHSSARTRVQVSQTNTSMAAIPDTMIESPATEAANEERELIQRVNGLARALDDFAAAYRAGQVDVKRVKALRKALHELEKSEWFKPEKSK